MIEYRPTAPDLTHDHAGGTALPAVAMDLAPTGRVRYTTRLPADPNAVCYPEIDPDEEPYGDTAAWRPRPSLLALVTRAVTWKYRRIMKDMLNG